MQSFNTSSALGVHPRAQMQDDEPHPLEVEQPGLAACYAAAARGVSVAGERTGQPPLRLIVLQDVPPQGSSQTAMGMATQACVAEDVDTCSQCGGPMRWLEAATTPDAISRLLADHGLAPRAPPHRSPLPSGQLRLPFAG